MNKAVRFFFRFVIVLLAAGSAAVIWIFSGGGESAPSDPPPVPVRAERAVVRDVEDVLTIHGNLKSSNQVTILPKVSGAVTALYADVGDSVEEGDVLAEIDREAYRLDKERADAAYAAASSTWVRIDRLYGTGSATRQDWEEARAAYLSAEAQAAAARLRYGWTRVPAPTAGVVLMRHAAVGSLVSPEAGTPLFTIGSLESLDVDFLVPEAHLATFEGRTPRIRVAPEAFPDELTDAEISTVAPWVDPITRTFVVTCRLPPDDEKAEYLRPGMLMTAEFVLSVRQGVRTLPVGALTSGKGIWSVNDDGKAEFFPLTSPRIVGPYVLVPDSFGDGLFVTEGQHFLAEGAEVRILNGAETAGGSRMGNAE